MLNQKISYFSTMNAIHEMAQQTFVNQKLDFVEELVLFTDSHIFLTGKAGTGKTTFLKNLPMKTYKRMAVVAPTGVAALNAGGQTIHSFFQLPYGPQIPENANATTFPPIDSRGKGIIPRMPLFSAEKNCGLQQNMYFCDRFTFLHTVKTRKYENT